MRSFRQPRHERAGVPSPATGLLHIGVELVDEACDRQRRAVDARFVDREAEVLAHPVDREAEIELVLRHRAPAVEHLPARRGAARDRLEHLVGIELRRLRRSEEHTSELQSLMRITYAVFCLKKKKNQKQNLNIIDYST